MIKVIFFGILIISNLFANNIYMYNEIEEINEKYYEISTKKLANGYYFWDETMNSMLPLENGEVNGVSFSYTGRNKIGLIIETYFKNKIHGPVIEYYNNMNIAKIAFYYPNKFEEKKFLENGNLWYETVIYNNKKGFVKKYKNNEVWIEANIEIDEIQQPKIIEAFEYNLTEKIRISNEEFFKKAKE